MPKRPLSDINGTDSMLAALVLTSLRKTGLGIEEEAPLITDEPKLPSFLCFPSQDALKKYRCGDLIGQGSALEEPGARARAYAELLERLCLANPDTGRFVNGSYNELRSALPVIDPWMFNCYSDEQFDNLPDHLIALRNEKLSWVEVREVIPQDRSVFIPAQLVYLTDDLSRQYPVRRESITTGAALGIEGSDLVLSTGLLESIERDACIAAWLGLFRPRQLHLKTPAVIQLCEYVKRYYLELHVLDVTSNLTVPVALVFCIDRSGLRPALTSGARAAFTMEQAVLGAIKEALQPRRTNRFLSCLREDLMVGNSRADIRDVFARFEFWSVPEQLSRLDEWLAKAIDKTSTETCIDAPNISTFQHLCDILQRHGMAVYQAEVSLDEMKSSGLSSIKVLSPELHPLYLNEDAISLYSRHYGAAVLQDGALPHPIT